MVRFSLKNRSEFGQIFVPISHKWKLEALHLLCFKHGCHTMAIFVTLPHYIVERVNMSFEKILIRKFLFTFIAIDRCVLYCSWIWHHCWLWKEFTWVLRIYLLENVFSQLLQSNFLSKSLGWLYSFPQLVIHSDSDFMHSSLFMFMSSYSKYSFSHFSITLSISIIQEWYTQYTLHLDIKFTTKPKWK